MKVTIHSFRVPRRWALFEGPLSPSPSPSSSPNSLSSPVSPNANHPRLPQLLFLLFFDDLFHFSSALCGVLQHVPVPTPKLPREEGCVGMAMAARNMPNHNMSCTLSK
eukprot:TRINITY_DN44848_c0_g1_i1.p1 TRINITY_DN44848_c0_g1~~TRINITY_DN44848_c0_g1_i1.p1  ORF type:complete len:108 (-),score=18.84 TRINITY_DN44848_c0_g1_i1:286-609(-)